MADIGDKDFVFHEQIRFYPTDLQNKPEFMFKNHLITLKEKEVGLIEDLIKQQELEDERAKSSMQAAQPTGKGGAKAPAKGAPAKAPAKGAAADDKNAP